MNRVTLCTVQFTVGSWLGRHFLGLLFMAAAAHCLCFPGRGNVYDHGRMGVVTGGAVRCIVMGRILRSMTSRAFRYAFFAVLLVAVGAGNFGLMARTFCINHIHLSSVTVFAQRLTRGICKRDVSRHVRIMAGEALFICSPLLMGLVTLQTGEKCSMLRMADDAVYFGMIAGIGLHLFILLRMAGAAERL